MTPSRQTVRAAFAAKRLLDGSPLGRLPLVRAAGRAVGRRLLSATGPEPGAVAVTVHGFRFVVPPAFRVHHLERAYEPATSAWLARALGPGMAAVDVGAHIGYFTLLMSRLVGPGGRVWALEPAPDNLGYLRENVSANALDNVVVLPLAAGTGSGRRRLLLAGSSDSHGFFEHPLTHSVGSLDVEEARLDEAVPGVPDLVKIDVEGGELDVLAGMERILAESARLHLVIEWNPACLAKAGRDARELPEELERRGFRLGVIDDAAGRTRTVADTLAGLASGELGPAWYGNIVATRGDTS